MLRPMFILNGESDQIGEEYQNGIFAQVPEYQKSGSWFLLTDGIKDDIIVNEKTTQKEIRHGKYKRLIEVSRNTLVFTHTFNSNCCEISYTFKVTIKANVRVNDPIKFVANIQNISVQDFLNNQFSLDVKAVTRKYSILNYNGVDEELTRVLTSSVVIDDTSGLSYQVTTVMTEPNEEAMQILKKRDEMAIKHKITTAAGEIAKGSKGKKYADAIWEMAAKGEISDVDAIKRIDEYNEDKIDVYIKLRDESFVNNESISEEVKNNFLPSSLIKSRINESEQLFSNDVNELFNEEE